MKIRKIPVMDELQRKIRYKLPISGRTIEIPESQRNKTIALACLSTVEAGAGMVFTLGGIATREPMFTGVGLAILGKVAGMITMVKGHLWDFAKNISTTVIKSGKNSPVTVTERLEAELAKDRQLLNEISSADSFLDVKKLMEK